MEHIALSCPSKSGLEMRRILAALQRGEVVSYVSMEAELQAPAWNNDSFWDQEPAEVIQLPGGRTREVSRAWQDRFAACLARCKK